MCMKTQSQEQTLMCANKRVTSSCHLPVFSSVSCVSLMLSDSLTDTLCLGQQNRILHQHTISFIHHYSHTLATFMSYACHIHSIPKAKQSEQIWNTDKYKAVMTHWKPWLHSMVKLDKKLSWSLRLSSPQSQTATKPNSDYARTELITAPAKPTVCSAME